MKLSDCLNSCNHIRSLLRVGLVKHTLVTITRCSGLIGIYSWNYDYFIFNFFLHFGKTCNIVNNCIFIIGRAWPDNCKKFIRFARKNLTNLFICLFFNSTASLLSGNSSLISSGEGSVLTKLILILFLQNTVKSLTL